MPIDRTPTRRSWVIGVGALALALVLAGWGVFSRVTAEAALRDSTEKAAIPTVIVAKAVAGPPIDEIVLPGSVKAILETPIYARTSGYVKTWKTDIGASVKAGQLLAQIESPEVDQQLRQAQADLKTAQANAAVAQSTAKRVADLVATQSVSRQEGEDRAATAAATAALVASNQANVERLRQLIGFERVTAPYAGVITARDTDVGNLINAGSGVGPELFRIADIGKLRIYVQAPQAYAAEIKIGAPAELHFSDHPGQVFKAAVTRTARALDPQSRTLLVELDIDNKNGLLFPGAFAEVHFKLPAANRGVRLSANTLLFRAEGLRVATVDAGGRVRMKAITVGRDFGTTVEVVDGVSPSDAVILNPPASLDDGDMVHAVAAKPPAGTKP
jgi:RND family efflux transporter MFP subunit